MKLKELRKIRKNYLNKYVPYRMKFYKDFNYRILNNILYQCRSGAGSNDRYNDAIIMFDTETSKICKNLVVWNKKEGVKKWEPVPNYIVAWTISIRAFDRNIVTLWGRKPSELVECMANIHNYMPGEKTIMYAHNMPYDWTFIRKWLFKSWGHPDKQLNVKSHYPIYINFPNGIEIKDSLILAQRGLEKWANDLQVEHRKATGNWDYEKIRTQGEEYSDEELIYIEHDTLAGVECIEKTMKALHKHIWSMPYTATGIPREDVRKIGKEYGARDSFLRMVLEYEQYVQANRTYHGGYTHANRYVIDKLIFNVICRDFSSSYPFVMLSEKYPMEKFTKADDCTIDYILKDSSNAYMFKLTMAGEFDSDGNCIRPIELRNVHNPMPALQFSKCVKVINPIIDNGRILQADYVEIYLNELDVSIINEQYKIPYHICTEVYYAYKDYLPRWFTDYVYSLYEAKCKLKKGDPVLYSIAKSKLNSLYGMCVQRSIQDNLVEDYVTGEYEPEKIIDKNGEPMDDEALYNKYVNNRNSILPYQWGVWVTSYAMKNLFTLAKATIDENLQWGFVYSDTDSIYSTYWNEEELNKYNESCKKKLKDNGYGPVLYDETEYWLGVAEFDGAYREFKVLGAKRYACRYADDPRNKENDRGKLKITVAGVPKKKGALCLDNDINKFTSYFRFDGEKTGKLTHHYMIEPEPYTNDDGIEIADSIDLTPCDYLLKSIDVVDVNTIWDEEIEMQVYEETI